MNTPSTFTAPTYRLTYRDGYSVDTARYGSLVTACKDGAMWSAALGVPIEVRDAEDVRVAWVDTTGRGGGE